MHERAITEFDCIKSGEDAAVKALQTATKRNQPVVFRGCVRHMPAIQKWSTNDYLRKKALKFRNRKVWNAFSVLWNKNYDPTSTNLPKDLLEDVRWDSSPFGRMLPHVTDGPAAITAWVSHGMKKASSHFDTFENLHAVIAGEKKIFLVSPEFAANMYVFDMTLS